MSVIPVVDTNFEEKFDETIKKKVKKNMSIYFDYTYKGIYITRLIIFLLSIFRILTMKVLSKDGFYL